MRSAGSAAGPSQPPPPTARWRRTAILLGAAAGRIARQEQGLINGRKTTSDAVAAGASGTDDQKRIVAAMAKGSKKGSKTASDAVAAGASGTDAQKRIVAAIAIGRKTTSAIAGMAKGHKTQADANQDLKPPCPVAGCSALRKSISKWTPPSAPLPLLASQQAQAAPASGWPTRNGKGGARLWRCADHGDFCGVAKARLTA